MAYLVAMRFGRVLQILMVLALLLAPAGMLGSHAAMAMPHEAAAATMDHCDTQREAPGDEQRQSMIDCAIACSAMPSAHAYEVPQPLYSAPEYRNAAVPGAEGTRPEAATPPPRLS